MTDMAKDTRGEIWESLLGVGAELPLLPDALEGSRTDHPDHPPFSVAAFGGGIIRV